MSTEDFIAACLKVPTKLIDDLCDEYNVDFSEGEVFDMLDCCAGDVFHKWHYENFGGMLVRHVLSEIIEQYTDVLDEDKFDYDIDGADSAIIYDGVRIENKQQLDEIYNRVLECSLTNNEQ